MDFISTFIIRPISLALNDSTERREGRIMAQLIKSNQTKPVEKKWLNEVKGEGDISTPSEEDTDVENAKLRQSCRNSETPSDKFEQLCIHINEYLEHGTGLTALSSEGVNALHAKDPVTGKLSLEERNKVKTTGQVIHLAGKSTTPTGANAELKTLLTEEFASTLDKSAEITEYSGDRKKHAEFPTNEMDAGVSSDNETYAECQSFPDLYTTAHPIVDVERSNIIDISKCGSVHDDTLNLSHVTVGLNHCKEINLAYNYNESIAKKMEVGNDVLSLTRGMSARPFEKNKKDFAPSIGQHMDGDEIHFLAANINCNDDKAYLDSNNEHRIIMPQIDQAAGERIERKDMHKNCILQQHVPCTIGDQIKFKVKESQYNCSTDMQLVLPRKCESSLEIKSNVGEICDVDNITSQSASWDKGEVDNITLQSASSDKGEEESLGTPTTMEVTLTANYEHVEPMQIVLETSACDRGSIMSSNLNETVIKTKHDNGECSKEIIKEMRRSFQLTGSNILIATEQPPPHSPPTSPIEMHSTIPEIETFMETNSNAGLFIKKNSAYSHMDEPSLANLFSENVTTVRNSNSLSQMNWNTFNENCENNIILNPSDFEYLLTKGNSNEEIERSSLLLRFDPLLGVPVPSNQIQLQPDLAIAKQKLLRTNNACLSPTIEEEEQHQNEGHQAFSCDNANATSSRNSTDSAKTEQDHATLPISPPERQNEFSEALLKKKKYARMSVDVIKDTKIESDFIQSSDNSSIELDEKRRNLKMDELEKKIKNEVLKTEDIEKKLKDAEQREEALIKRITDKDKTIAKMNGVIEAYEKAIAELISEKEQVIQNYEKQLADVKADRDSNYHHLTSLETTFSDLHVKYEKSKEMTSQLKSSEESLMTEKKQNIENLRLQEQRYEKMKNHAMQQLEIANKKLESMTKEHSLEITKLKALLKKEEISRASTNEQLQQKTRENEELVKICDELINGQGS